MKRATKKTTKLPKYYLILNNTPLPKAKQYVANKRCECGCFVRLYDTEKCELICAKCGLVYGQEQELSEKNLVYGSWTKHNSYTGSGYTPSEKEFMKQKGIKTKTFMNTHELNVRDYKYLLDVFKNDLCLSGVDISNVMYIIRECNGLNNIHSRLNYERILLGICRYVLKQKGIKGYLINLNNSLYREYNLRSKDCAIIEKNIEKYRKLYRCNT